MTIKKIIIGGASITDSPWFTWADFLQQESGMPIVDISARGVGNEYIASSIVNVQSQLDNTTLVVLMLTNIDKFDWYVQGQQLKNLENEKHCPKKLTNDSGFWCTGSWFPGDKEIFKNYFYNEDYFCVKTIQQILLLETICQKTNAVLEIFFDSPIWTHTDQDIINIGKTQDYTSRYNFLSGDYAKSWSTLLAKKHTTLDNNSLIGFCWQNKLPWYNQQYKGHPPSSSHWKFYDNVMRKRLTHHLPLVSCQSQMSDKIKKFDEQWKSC